MKANNFKQNYFLKYASEIFSISSCYLQEAGEEAGDRAEGGHLAAGTSEDKEVTSA